MSAWTLRETSKHQQNTTWITSTFNSYTTQVITQKHGTLGCQYNKYQCSINIAKCKDLHWNAEIHRMPQMAHNYQLTNNCHQRVKVAYVDALLGYIDKIFNHTNAISFLQLLKTTKIGLLSLLLRLLLLLLLQYSGLDIVKAFLILIITIWLILMRIQLTNKTSPRIQSYSTRSHNLI